MNNYLVLKFRNAKLFRNKKSKDFVFDLTSQRQRAGEPQFIEPITIYQISNLLHVLFGERPIPSNRISLYKKNDYYFEKAKETYLKVEGHKRFNKNKEQYEFVTEFLSTKKATWNSFQPQSQINWEIVKNYVGNENLKWFLTDVEQILGIKPYSLPFNKIRIELLKHNTEELFNKLREHNLTGLVQYILDRKNSYQVTSKEKHTALNINNGVENVILLRGEILVPVSEEDIERLKENKGCATILDGGMVWIEGIVNSDHLSIDGFEKVSEISSEKY